MSFYRAIHFISCLLFIVIQASGEGMAITKEQEIAAQKEILHLMTSEDRRPAGGGINISLYDKKIEEYVNKGYSKSLFQLEIMKEAVSKQFADEIIQKLPQNPWRYRFRDMERCGIDYDDVAEFLPQWNGFVETLNEYLANEDPSQDDKYETTIISKPWSGKEIDCFIKRFLELTSPAQKQKALRVFKIAPSRRLLNTLWDYASEGMDESSARIIFEIVRDSEKIHEVQLRAVIDRAIREKNTNILEYAFDYLKSQSRNNNQAQKILTEYMTKSDPFVVKIVLSNMDRGAGYRSLNETLFVLLDNPKYQECHVQIGKILAKMIENPEVEKKLRDYLTANHNEIFAYEVAQSISSHTLAGSSDNFLKFLEDQYGPNVHAAIKDKRNESREFDNEMKRRQQDRKLDKVEYILNMVEIAQYIHIRFPSQSSQNEVEKTFLVCERMIEESAAENANNPKIEQFKQKLETSRKRESLIVSNANQKTDSPEFTQLKNELMKKYNLPEEIPYRIEEYSIRVYSGNKELVIQGRGDVMERAEHKTDGNKYNVWLYFKPIVNSRGESGSSFLVRIPVDGTMPESVRIESKGCATDFPVKPFAEQPSLLEKSVEVTSVRIKGD